MSLFKRFVSVFLVCMVILSVMPMKDVIFTALASENEAQQTNDSQSNVIELKYGDRYSLEQFDGCDIVDSGVPTSYKVGYAVEENTPDDSVIKVQDNVLYAVGIGEGTVNLTCDGEVYTYTVKVEKAPVSMFLLIGQSNMCGYEGNASKSVANENGQVYSTYGVSTYMTEENAEQFVPSALEGEYSLVNVKGTSDCLSYHPLNSLTEEGDGKKGLDGALAYQWNKMTGDKVWLVNAAHGGSSIFDWIKGAVQYDEAVKLFKAAQKVMAAEISAGHYELKNYGYFWLQGCTDGSKTADVYYENFLSMHDSLKEELACDFDGDGEKESFEFCDVILPRAGVPTANSYPYRRGEYTDTTDKIYFSSFLDLEMRGPRVAQYYLCNNPDNDINMVCNISDSWVYLPDGTDGVKEYFEKNYPYGRVDYPVQLEQVNSWYTPTTPEDIHHKIHYNQIGYNEIGIEAARNAAYTHGRAEKPDVPVSVNFYNWTGYQQVDTVEASFDRKSATLVVPVVYPVYESKSVTYKLSDEEHMDYELYDLTADIGYGEGLTLTAVGVVEKKTVTLTGTAVEETHRFTKYISDNNASCLEDGTKTAFCDLGCGVRDTVTDEGTRLEHIFSDYEYDYNETCTKDGTKTALCALNCGTAHSVAVEGTATGHLYASYHLEPATYSENSALVSNCEFCQLEKKVEYENTKLSLAKPGFLMATSTNKAVTLTWEEIPDATGYRIFLRNKETGKWDIAVKTTGKQTTYTISGLKSGESYTYAVRPYINDGKIIWSPSFTMATVKTATASSKKVQAKNSNVSEVTLTWSKIKDAYGYRVYQYNTQTKKWNTVIKTTRAVSATIKNLEPAENYIFAVRYYSKSGSEIIWSSVSSMMKTTIITAPAVTKKITSAAEENTVTLNWSKVNGATGYRIYRKTSSGWKAIKTTTATSYTVKKLGSGQKYTFAVKAYTKLGNSTVWSNKYATHTAQTLPASPSKLTAVSSADSVTLSWNKAGGETGYRVYIFNYETGKWETAVRSTAKRTVTVEIPKKGKGCLFAVRSYVKTDGKIIWATTYKSLKVTV